MNITNIESSVIDSAAYDKKVLTIRFKSGAVYEYTNVPKKVFSEFANSESKGKYYNQNIIGEFESERVA